MSSYDLPPLIYTRGRTCSVLGWELTAMEELEHLHITLPPGLILRLLCFLLCRFPLYATYRDSNVITAGGSLPQIHVNGECEKFSSHFLLILYQKFSKKSDFLFQNFGLNARIKFSASSSPAINPFEYLSVLL